LNPQNDELLDTKFTNPGTKILTLKTKKVGTNYQKFDGRLIAKRKLKIEH
jgi:hypothetical protein